MDETPGTYRFRNLRDEHVTGEIWSLGPKANSLWVLGPEGPVVVDVKYHRQVRYAIPEYKPHMHKWIQKASDGFGVEAIEPMDCRCYSVSTSSLSVRGGVVTRRSGMAQSRWSALVKKQLTPEIDEMALPLNWDLTYEFPSAA